MELENLFRIIPHIILAFLVFGASCYSGGLKDIVWGQTSNYDDKLNNEAETNSKYMMLKLLNVSPDSTKNTSKYSLYSDPSFILIDNGTVTFGLHSFWSDPLLLCTNTFKCKSVDFTGWKDNTSFQVSTTNTTNTVWSWLEGKELDVTPKEKFQIVTHMKLNKWATGSHIVLEGFNETSKQWYQIEQCPSGTSGPLEWREFVCNISIPDNTTKIRPSLRAGSSSEPNKEAATWFDSLYIINGPFTVDTKLKVHIVYKGLELPTAMAFLGPKDIIVSEGLKGTVQRIVNGKLTEPLINLDVASREGLLGIATVKNMTIKETGIENSRYVFLYFTREGKGLTEPRIANYLYRYELVNNTLVNPELLLRLPAGFEHNGGKILIGPDKYIYLTVGELRNLTSLAHERNRSLNYVGKDADDPDGRGAILRFDQNGQLVDSHGILGVKEPLNKYYAYGIRNSFGIDFDPLTGKLWDTENGPLFGDEINLVVPGFNSGWRKVQGIWTVDVEGRDENKGNLASEKPHNLVLFGGKGKYSPPEFTWDHSIGPTSIKFVSTDKLGKQYENDLLVADANNGRIYHFELNQNRTGLELEGSLIDEVANSDKEMSNLIFADGFDLVTDLEIGPDGNLYVLSHTQGTIYRIDSSKLEQDPLDYLHQLPIMSLQLK